MKQFLTILFLALPLAAQPTTYVLSQPDCQIFFHFTAAGQTSPTSPNAGLDNRTAGCTTWNVSYVSSGFTAVNVVLQSAANNNGAPATYNNGFPVQQVVLSGVNPMLNTTAGFVWITGYNAWVQMLLFSKTGTGVVDGAAYGWRIPSASANGTAAANVNIAQFGGTNVALGQAHMAASMPVVIADNQSALSVSQSTTPWVFNQSQAGGSSVYGCNSQALFNLSTSGDTLLVAASGSKVIRVCHISFTTTAPEDFQLDSDTNCATSPAALTGLYKQVNGLALDFGPYSNLVVPSGKALCLNQSAVQVTGGVVIYDQR